MRDQSAYYFFLMKILLPFMAAIFFWSCKPDQSGLSGEADLLLNLERTAIEKEFENDTAYLSSVMDSTFIELSNGKIKNKHEVLETIYSNNITNLRQNIILDSFLLEEPVVHVYDNSAVVTFILHSYRKKDQIPYERWTRFYDVWVKRDNKWKAVTWQATPIDQ
jgi:hypothetical protein